MSEAEKDEIDELKARLKDLNTAFFGEAFKLQNRIKGQLWEYKEAKFRYLDSLRTNLAVYLQSNGWAVKLDDKNDDIFCSATNGGMSISYSAEQDGRYERNYFVVATNSDLTTGDKVEFQLILDAESDFDDSLLDYFDYDKTNFAKVCKAKSTTVGKLEKAEQLKEIVGIAEKAVNHNTGLNGKYTFQLVAGTEWVKRNGQERNEIIEIKFTDAEELVSAIKRICENAV